ncbi:MAG: cell division protein ZapB [Treponema sp.]|jgi:FtsZ-binding cell division protein ZapB|nr:cell division protein ZapB [Treponema sp.]
MVSLEQVKLLETKVARAIDYVERVSGENAVLQEKLDSYQRRIDELEVLVQRFKEDQGRIEDGILSALDRLNQFEDAIEKSLANQGVSRELPAGESGPAQTGPVVPAGDSGIGEEAGPAEPEHCPEEGGAGEDGEKTAENGELDIF